MTTTGAIAAEEQGRDAGLVRGVGLWPFTFSIINGVIGAGIFALPAAMAASAGDKAFLAYLICAVAMGAVVICFAEGGSRVPTSGGAYGTVEAALGPMAGFLAGVYIWTASVLACGGVAAALCDALGRMEPTLAGQGARLAILIAVFGVMGLFNTAGAGLAARIIAWGTVVKLVPLVLFVGFGAVWLLSGHTPPPAPAAAPEGGHLAEAMILALFAFCGMETPLSASGEVANPTRNVPRATMLAMLIVLIFYLAIQFVAQGLLGAGLGSAKEPLAEGGRLIDPRLGLLLFAGGALSRLIWIGSDLLGAPRVLFAFARDGMLPKMLGRTHPRFATPYVSIWVHAAIAFAFAATGSFAKLAIWSTLATAGLYFLACWAALLLRRRGVAIVGKPLSFAILPAAAVVGMLAMATAIGLAKTEEIAGFVGVTLASLVLYLVMRRRG